MFSWIGKLKRKIEMKYISGVVRHLLTIGAGALVTLGILEPEDTANLVELVAGIVMAAVAMWWSVKAKD